MTDRSYAETRDALHLIASHILARAQFASTERLGLRAAPGGFSTVQFGEQPERLRVSAGWLVRERAGGSTSSTTAIALDRSNLEQLAEFAGVTLTGDFSVGRETPELGDIERPLRVDAGAERLLAGWYSTTAQALDRLVGNLGSIGAGAPTLAQLWPEHFDLALDIAYDDGAADERRVNVGGSPGDAFHDEPYMYVGPWTAERPGDDGFWNAPFGAVLGRDALVDGDQVAGAVAFFEAGFARLRGQPSSR